MGAGQSTAPPAPPCQAGEYTAHVNIDAPGNDIRNAGTRDLCSLRKECDADVKCRGFNVGGWLKHNVDPRVNWPNTTLYTKNAPPPPPFSTAAVEPTGIPATQKPTTQAATPAPVQTPQVSTITPAQQAQLDLLAFDSITPFQAQPPPQAPPAPQVVTPTLPAPITAQEFQKYQEATNLLISDDPDFRNVVVTYLTFPRLNPWQSAYRRQQILRQAQAYARANPGVATNVARDIGFFRPAAPGTRRNVTGEMAQWVNQLATRQQGGRATGATIFGGSVMSPLAATGISVGAIVLILLLGVGAFALYAQIRSRRERKQ